MAYAHDRPRFLPPRLQPLADLCARASFYPLLFGQGVWVRRTAMRLPEPRGPREGVIGEGPDLRLLITGDSTAAGVGVRSQSRALSGLITRALAPHFRTEWQLIAKTGATTLTTLQTLQRTPPRRADIAVLALGVNDITSGARLSAWIDRKAALFDYLKTRVGVEHIYVSGIPPMGEIPLLPNPLRWALGHRAAEFDTALRRLCAETPGTTWLTVDVRLTRVNMAADLYHPGPGVYEQWAGVFSDRILADRT